MEEPDLSLAFYHYLCDVVGTENVVNMRRLIFTTLDNVESNTDFTRIISGSKAEGLDLDGSDFDFMVVPNGIPVYEFENDEKLSETIPLIMDTFDCKQGFTKIKIISTGHLSNFNIPCEDKAGVFYLSSTKCKNDIPNDDWIIHGPCNSSPDGSVDYAGCLRCSTWISQAKPWISRSRHTRASNDVVNAIIDFGVLFVPIGCKNSPNKDIEWRISFSYAEKLLIWSFNHVQLFCYALLKILLKDIIKKTTDDLLCSYFLKTIMLWICEETKSSQWKSNTILSSFMSCLDRLVYCVQYKTCAHYFIPENDLFAERFDKQQHSLVLSTLKQLQSLGWKCLLQTQTLRSFRDIIEPIASSLTNIVSYYPSLVWFYQSLNTDYVSKLTKSVYYSKRANTKDFYIYMLSKLSTVKSQTCLTGDRRLSGNKKSYTILRKRLLHLIIGLNSDAGSGWLLLASHFYVNKQYKICKEILTDCMVKCTLDKIVLTSNPSIEKQTRFNLMSKKINSCPLNIIRHFIIDYVKFGPSSHNLPKEMELLHDGKFTLISPVVFGVFLKYLCFHHLRNQSGKDESLQELELVVQNKYFIVNAIQLEQAQMLLSIAYSMS